MKRPVRYLRVRMWYRTHGLFCHLDPQPVSHPLAVGAREHHAPYVRTARDVLAHLQLWFEWRDKPGLQSLIVAHLGVHKSTISRDLQRLFPLMTDCPTCGQLRPRHWWAEEEA
jgi:hypothetical protein